EHARPHDRDGVLGAPDSRCPGLGTASLGRGRGGRSRRLHDRDDPRPRGGGRRPHRRHVEAQGLARASVRATPREKALTRQPALEGRIVLAPRWPYLAPRALLRILVVAEANEARAVPEAVALHLVVAHLGDKLRADRRLLQLAAPPAVGLREAAVRRVLQ